MKKVWIHWFRNDLRVSDHEILSSISSKCDMLIPVFIFDKRNWKKTELGLPKTGKYRTKFLLETLESLRKKLKSLGSNLLILDGESENIIPQLCYLYKADVVSFEEENTSEEKIVEKNVIESLNQARIEIQTFWSKTLIHKDDLNFDLQDLPNVFTSFRKKSEKNLKIREDFSVPKSLPEFPAETKTYDIPALEKFGFDPNFYESRKAIPFIGGEDRALQRLEHYFWKSNAVTEYKKTRNGLIGADYSTKFSPWLANGSISPRTIYFELKSYEEERTSNDSTYWVQFELLWRDYYRFVSMKFGDQIFYKNGIKNIDLSLEKDLDKFWIWANGETHLDFINANMEEINKTGFMSNRGRQNVASYLVKDMKIDWRLGASYFESLLIDYDVASNWGNWLYVAGLGNDPREDRYFNVQRQQKMYDPHGDYVRLWLGR